MELQEIIDQLVIKVTDKCVERMNERMPIPVEDDIISKRKVQEMLDITKSTLFKWEKRGIIKQVGKVGKMVYYSKTEILKAIKSFKY